ncbi:MAG: flagellar basal body rod protein FlgB [Candidatus Atribacteria bacterium]|nr:flagellar basal body rod protein FlgB [Candidatus Atribacteria bacterium]
MQDITLRILERGLDLSMARQKLLVENVANVETPGYRRKDLDFESVLQKEYREIEKKDVKLRRTDVSHLEGTEGKEPVLIGQEENVTVRQDGGGVDAEKEMTTVLENALYYQALTRMVSGKLDNLRIAIREVR